ncbi:unnamed protein product [Lota lota]
MRLSKRFGMGISYGHLGLWICVTDTGGLPVGCGPKPSDDRVQRQQGGGPGDSGGGLLNDEKSRAKDSRPPTPVPHHYHITHQL